MTVGLDIRYLTHGLTGGVCTYVRHLAQWLPRVAPDLTFLYYGDTKAPLDLEGLPSTVSVRLLPYRSPVSSLWLDARLGHHMAGDGVRVAHFPANLGCAGRYRLVVTVHDTYNLFPFREHFRAFGRDPWRVSMMLYLGRQTRRALREADTVITVSEHARQDLAARSGRDLDRIVAIPEAADERLSPCDPATVSKVLAAYGLPPRYVLADGIKNPTALVEAWPQVAKNLRQPAALVFFSREPRPRPEIAAAIDGRQIHFVPQPPLADLAALMTGATVFAFPSFYEGFGLPLVEAMRCGLPVVASTRGAIPEVLGGAGRLFEVDDRAALTRELTAVLDDEPLRLRLAEASRTRAAAFSWERTARETAEVYRRLLTERILSR